MDTQAPRTDRVTVMVSPGEKRAVRFVADALGLTESDVMRDMTVAEVVAEYGRMREALGLQPAA